MIRFEPHRRADAGAAVALRSAPGTGKFRFAAQLGSLPAIGDRAYLCAFACHEL